MEKIKAEFHKRMVRIYAEVEQACGYRATRFRQMVAEKGGLATARELLHTTRTSNGLAELSLAGRLDLSMEQLVLQAPWSQLFTEQELQTARDRLKTPPPKVARQ